LVETCSIKVIIMQVSGVDGIYTSINYNWRMWNVLNIWVAC